jgi:hypothetical protein
MLSLRRHPLDVPLSSLFKLLQLRHLLNFVPTFAGSHSLGRIETTCWMPCARLPHCTGAGTSVDVVALIACLC